MTTETVAREVRMKVWRGDSTGGAFVEFAVPSDPGACLIFGDEQLFDAGAWQSRERLDSGDERRDPGWEVASFFEGMACVVVSPAKRGDAALALECAELEGRQRQTDDKRDQLLFFLPGNEIGLIAQALGLPLIRK